MSVSVTTKEANQSGRGYENSSSANHSSLFYGAMGPTNSNKLTSFHFATSEIAENRKYNNISCKLLCYLCIASVNSDNVMLFLFAHHKIRMPGSEPGWLIM